MKLYYVRKEIEVLEGKEKVVKRYTNFYLQIEVNGKSVNIPIQPVNFGNKSNRTNYSLLLLASEEIKDENKAVF